MVPRARRSLTLCLVRHSVWGKSLRLGCMALVPTLDIITNTVLGFLVENYSVICTKTPKPYGVKHLRLKVQGLGV